MIDNIRSYLPLDGIYNKIEPFLYNPQSKIYLAAHNNEPSDVMACFLSVSAKVSSEQIKQAINNYSFLSKQSNLVPIKKCILYALQDGSHNIILLLPLFKQFDIKKTTLDQNQKIELFFKIARTVEVLHKNGYVHGNICHENILLGDGYVLSGVFFNKLISQHTKINYNFINNEYISPDAFLKRTFLDETNDIYSLGRFGYALFNNGKFPESTGILSIPKNTPQWIAEIILRACNRNPQHRWKSVEEMCNALAGAYNCGLNEDNLVVEPVKEKSFRTQSDMEELYPDLVHYLGIFDSDKSITFEPPKLKEKEENEEKIAVQIINRNKNMPWVTIAVTSLAIIIILYLIISSVQKMPSIESSLMSFSYISNEKWNLHVRTIDLSSGLH